MNYLFDIDGVLLEDWAPIPGSKDAIAACKKKGISFLYLTNTTLYSTEQILERLRPIDPGITRDRIVTPGRVARQLLLENGKRCRLYIPDNLRPDFSGICETDPPEVVVLADLQSDFTHQRLTEIFHLLFEGATLIALHKNRYWQAGGRFHLDLGGYVSLLEYASQTEARIVGKPSPDYFKIAMDLLGGTPETTTMVGDDIESDVGAAQRLGMTGILVKTGKYREERVIKSGVRPDHVIPTVGGIVDLLG
ncbi:MAG TPA: TIGR01458 family HAD-type hydrolase [Thermoanaerobaculia bacterium]|nr:TIGR01458 family HAD-type hydrolase [Thermoanaerobaculia bacterium]HUM29035.1 TIGR01458 family HAD-type hydrolase [Thermoanaerobaculia bacterium]HXK67409.1 TIGR01458 family HAD-type hydrolase [Thermoanaerobaculia bacterium]